jgi:ATP diphosphatase
MKLNNKKNIYFLDNDNLNNVEKLLKIMEYLRDPEKGCAWDKKQSFSSISPYTIEEAYEVAQAIQDEDFDDLKEELGDLLLQVVFLSQIANEKKLFSFEDVVIGIKEKLIRRHPHIFEESENLNTAKEVKDQWDKIKLNEKKKKNLDSYNSVFGRITKTLPSIIKTQKIQEEVSKEGFDFNDVEDCIIKLYEEIDEYKEAITSDDEHKLLDEGGDVLFSAVNILRKSGINSEEALIYANKKFMKRYLQAEKIASNEGRQFNNLNLEQKHEYWLKSKNLPD